ncbi:MAG TPA: LolA-related protein [Ramlibacter sp.]
MRLPILPRFPRLPRALLILFLALQGLAHAAAFDLDALLARLAQVKSGQATFTEDRRVAQLDRTLRSTGRLSFSAPDTFVRETLQPRPERMAVVGNQATITRGGRTQTTLLDSVPEAAAVVEAIRGTLTGNRATLERYFTPELQGSADQWHLDLVPRDARLRTQVVHLRVSGRQAEVRELQVMLADGDTSVMRIEPMQGTGRP